MSGDRGASFYTVETDASFKRDSDRLTIPRALLIVAGMAIGVLVFNPNFIPPDYVRLDDWQILHAAALAGIGLAYAPLIARRAFRGQPIELGGYFLLTQGACAWSLLLPAIADHAKFGLRDTPTVWLTHIWSLLALAMLLAALAMVRGDVRRLFRSPSWSDRLGIVMALAWAPQGARVVWAVYHDGPLLRG